jgi:hypothetical protein
LLPLLGAAGVAAPPAAAPAADAPRRAAGDWRLLALAAQAHEVLRPLRVAQNYVKGWCALEGLLSIFRTGTCRLLVVVF